MLGPNHLGIYLMADLRQNMLHLAGALMEHFHEGIIAPLRDWYINPIRRVTNTNIIF